MKLKSAGKVARAVFGLNGKAMIVLDFEFCKECEICINVCPRGVYTKGKSVNARGFRYPIPSNIDKCIRCRLCEVLCPDFVISVITR